MKSGNVVIGRLSKKRMLSWLRRDVLFPLIRLFEMPLHAHGLLIVLIIRIWYWDRWMRKQQQYCAREENNTRNVVLCVFVNHTFFIRLNKLFIRVELSGAFLFLSFYIESQFFREDEYSAVRSATIP